MLQLAICEAYGWTISELMATPIDYVLLIQGKMRIDSQREQKNAASGKKVR